MTIVTNPRRLVGEAQISAYNVDFDNLTYTMFIHDAVIETGQSVIHLPLLRTTQIIPFEGTEELTHWLRQPVNALMQTSWASKETNLYLEYIEGSGAGLMALAGGYLVLVPMRLEELFSQFGGN